MIFYDDADENLSGLGSGRPPGFVVDGRRLRPGIPPPAPRILPPPYVPRYLANYAQIAQLWGSPLTGEQIDYLNDEKAKMPNVGWSPQTYFMVLLRRWPRGSSSSGDDPNQPHIAPPPPDRDPPPRELPPPPPPRRLPPPPRRLPPQRLPRTTNDDGDTLDIDSDSQLPEIGADSPGEVYDGSIPDNSSGSDDAGDSSGNATPEPSDLSGASDDALALVKTLMSWSNPVMFWNESAEFIAEKYHQTMALVQAKLKEFRAKIAKYDAAKKQGAQQLKDTDAALATARKSQPALVPALTTLRAKIAAQQSKSAVVDAKLSTVRARFAKVKQKGVNLPAAGLGDTGVISIAVMAVFGPFAAALVLAVDALDLFSSGVDANGKQLMPIRQKLGLAIDTAMWLTVGGIALGGYLLYKHRKGVGHAIGSVARHQRKMAGHAVKLLPFLL